MSCSYKEALAPEQQPLMNMFLRSLSAVCSKAEGKGLVEPDVDSFIKTFRGMYGRPDGLSKSQRFRARHKAQGLCMFCAMPVAPGLSVCPEHYAKRKTYAHAHKTK